MDFSITSIKDVGKFQWCLMFLFAIGITPANWGNVGVLFFAPRLAHWCNVDNEDFQNLTKLEQKEVTKTWPRCQQPVQYGYHEYDKINANFTTLWKPCDKIIHEDNIFEWTVTVKFELFCDREWLIQLGNTIYMFGYFLGAIGCGALADRFGRKKVLLGSGVLGMVGNILVAQAPLLEVYYLARLLVALGDVSLYTSGFILCVEIVKKNQRVLVQGLATPFWLIACAGLSLLATVLPNFEYHCYIFAALFGIMVTVSWQFYPESVPWLNSQKRHDEANEIIKRIATFNNQNVEDLSHLCFVSNNEERTNWSPLDLLRTPLLRKRTFIQWCLWMNTVLINYGLMFNLGEFGSDLRTSVMISAAFDFPGFLLIIYIIEKLGRQVSMFLMMVLSAVMCLCSAPFVEDKSSIWLLVFALVGKAFAGNQLFLVYQHTPELYPTVIRTMGLGAASTVARVAGMIAPLISLLNVYWTPTLVVLLGVVGLLCSALVPFLPDTKGYELAQTLEEGETFLAEHTYGLILPPNFTCCGRKLEQNVSEDDYDDDLKIDDVRICGRSVLPEGPETSINNNMDV